MKGFCFAADGYNVTNILEATGITISFVSNSVTVDSGDQGFDNIVVLGYETSGRITI